MMTVMGVASEASGLEALYELHYRALVKLAALLVDDVGTCEEIVQDAFVAVHRRRPDDPSSFPAYLRSAVLNGARGHLRRRAVRRRPVALVPYVLGASPETGVVLRDDQHAVLAALRALPDRQRDVLMLRFWMDLSEREIADALGIAPGTVKTHVRRGLESLARTLEDRR
jgi:RNA polymerase sigma-70 factor (sigma-E family)